MKKINFVFGIHNHQPVGNFDFVFEDAYNKSYNPLLNIFSKFPEFKVNLHYTGILLDWIEKNHPEHFEIIKKMVTNGQAEILSGGFYEPILAVIPENDAVGQIRKQNEYIKQHFGYNPSGMWLAERVWEPTLPKVIHQSDIAYTVIDDAHFRYAGLKQDDLWGYYITEELGHKTNLFPISQKLRYTIPFEDPQETIDYLREIATEDGDRLIVFADDGEKFGVWPGTYHHVYDEGWLESFIELMLKNSDWINIIHFSEAIRKLKPQGTIYLPTASYAEMMHWALPAKSFKDYEDFENYLKKEDLFEEVNVFVRGGFWRNFLSKYTESNNMHKKMLYLSEKITQLENDFPPEKISQVRDKIWAGQCNCPYWHGVFGGLYLNHLRNAIYQNLIEAEVMIDSMQSKTTEWGNKICVHDINKDGFDEVLIESKHFSIYLSPEKGGMLYELDDKTSKRNFLDTLTRREEGYHQKLFEIAEMSKNKSTQNSDKEVASIHDMLVSKEEGLEEYLNYDWYEKKSFIDHFISKDISREQFYKVQYKELGDFVNQPYQIAEKSNQNNIVSLSLFRKGNIWLDNQFSPVTVRKKYQLYDGDSTLSTHYIIENNGSPLETRFAIELNFGMLAGASPDRYYVSDDIDLKKPVLNSHGEIKNGNHIGLVDEYLNRSIHVRSSKPAEIWFFPIETISLSESGFERVYQSSNIVLVFDLHLENQWDVSIETKLE